MHKESAFRMAYLFVPGEQLSLIGMRRKSVDGVNFCAHGNFFPVDYDFFCTINDLSSKGRGGRISDKYDAAFLARNILLQMVSNPPARAHAGPGHYD